MQSKRPKAGLGLSSAIRRDQMVTRDAAHATTRKPAPIKSASGKRTTPTPPKR